MEHIYNILMGLGFCILTIIVVGSLVGIVSLLVGNFGFWGIAIPVGLFICWNIGGIIRDFRGVK